MPDEITPDLTALADALRSVSPADPRIDRDAVMYRAGAASGRRRPAIQALWPALAAGLGLVALGEAAWLVRSSEPRIIERVVYVQVPAPTPSDPTEAVATAVLPILEPRPRTAHQRLAAQVLLHGLDGLPPSPTAYLTDSVPTSASAGRLLQAELRRLTDPGDSS